VQAPLIELDDTVVCRGRSKVFDGLSLRIPVGRHTAVIGPNGAGKSTLLKLLTRELYPVARAGASSVRILGRGRWNIWSLRRELGIISQELQHDYRPETSGLHVVLSGFRAGIGVWPHQHFADNERARARELIEALGVASLARRTFGTLSTGEQRRFLLARALVHRPQALVLDEPTAGLDVQASFAYLATIRALAQAGTTIVLVTHHLHEIPPEIEHVVLLRGGRLFAEGPRDEILQAPILSALFATSLKLVHVDGYVLPVPAGAVPTWPAALKSKETGFANG